MTPLIIVQARLNSTRLPGKVLLPIKGKPMLAYLLERAAMCHFSMSLATPDADHEEIKAGLGPGWAEWRRKIMLHDIDENDVAERFSVALEGTNFDTFIRLCGDSPLLDPWLIYSAWTLYEPPYLEIVSPVGCVEVCDTARFLEFLPDMNAHDREHVTGLLRPYGQCISVGHGPRLVVDTQADFDRVAAVIGKMDRPHLEYGWREICALRS